MALQKLQLAPGINKTSTAYSAEGGYYDCDKVRFRDGFPESIGGWSRAAGAATFLGVCRAALPYLTTTGVPLSAVGTNLKYYVVNGGTFHNITPFRLFELTGTGLSTTNLSTTVVLNRTGHGAATGDTVYIKDTSGTLVNNIPVAEIDGTHTITYIDANNFSFTTTTAANATAAAGNTLTHALHAYTITGASLATTNTSPVVVLTRTNHGALTGDYIEISGTSGVINGIPAASIDGNRQITYLTVNTLSFVAGANATSTGAGSGAVTLKYSFEINVGLAVQAPVGGGWGAGYAGRDGWGAGASSLSDAERMRLWSHVQYGDDVIFCPRSGGLFIWKFNGGGGYSTRGTSIAYETYADTVPTKALHLLVSESGNHIIAFGCNQLGDTTIDPMFIRWSDIENYLVWYPTITNLSGGFRLAVGSQIMYAQQTRQEILVLTDKALYSMQYIGAPDVFGTKLLDDNISVMGPNSIISVNGSTFWMGIDRFYIYNGRVSGLDCPLHKYVFSDFKLEQGWQVVAGLNEAYDEIWWFYCSANVDYPNRYVVYNMSDNVWYHGTLARTYWIDVGILNAPLAANYDSGTQTGRLLYHESGLDNGETDTPIAIESYVHTADFDIGEGDRFMLVNRILPDVTFEGSSAVSPSVTLAVYPKRFSGSNYGATESGTATRTATAPIEQYTEQVFVRLRGRQMSLRLTSNALGTAWRWGAPRIDARPDGRK